MSTIPLEKDTSEYNFLRDYFDTSCGSGEILNAALPTLHAIDISVIEDAYFSMLNHNDSVEMESVRSVYRWSVDAAITDHRDHRRLAYVPFRRFVSQNFANRCGTVTKLKIQRVYDVISELLRNSEVCPCVIIYNLFVRDIYCVLNMRHNSQYNYVRVFTGSNNESPTILVSYVEISDLMENTPRLFRTINSQRLRRTSPRVSVKKNKSKRKLLFHFHRVSGSTNDLSAISSIFVDHFLDCPHTNTRIVSRQLRSNDESAHISTYCLNCRRYI